jgi:hypothetical protein
MIGSVKYFFKANQIKNLIIAKSPPNGVNCSLQVSYGIEALIFLALVAPSRIPLFLRSLLFFDLLDFTIWVFPVLIADVSQHLL